MSVVDPDTLECDCSSSGLRFKGKFRLSALLLELGHLLLLLLKIFKVGLRYHSELNFQGLQESIVIRTSEGIRLRLHLPLVLS